MSQPKRSSHVLLASQQPAQVERIRYYLARGGFQTTISSYAEAEHQLTSAMPDAAIIAAGPDYSESLSACYGLRLSAGAAFPILMISSQDRELQPEHDVWRCADDYLLEPLDAETLLVRLSVLLKRKQAQAARPDLDDQNSQPVTEVDEFLRLTEVARADLARGGIGALALVGITESTSPSADRDLLQSDESDQRAATHLRLNLAQLSRFFMPRLRPAPGRSSPLAPYGSFSLLVYQVRDDAVEFADRLSAWQGEYRAWGPGNLVAGVAAFPEHATNILDLIGLADEALVQARSQGQVVCYQPIPQAAPVANQPQLLIVDDSQEQVEMLDLLVKQEGYRTLRAYNGEQALDVLSHQQPDLLLLDLAMPRLNGFDVMHRLRDRNGGRLEPPVIMVTANDCEESVLRGFELGARDYIIKPYHPRELLSRIQSILTIPTTTRGQ